MQLKTFLRDKICFASRFVPRKRFKLPRIIKLCHFVLRKRFRQNQIIAAKDMVTAAPQRSWSAQSLGETVRKVKHSSVRIAKLLQTLCRDFSLARIFGQSAPPRPSTVQISVARLIFKETPTIQTTPHKKQVTETKKSQSPYFVGGAVSRFLLLSLSFICATYPLTSGGQPSSVSIFGFAGPGTVPARHR